jgi:hypothetical protein
MSKETLEALEELWGQKPQLGELDTDVEEKDPDEDKLDYRFDYDAEFVEIKEYGIDSEQRFAPLKEETSSIVTSPPNEVSIDVCGNMHQQIPMLGFVCRGLFAFVWSLSYSQNAHFRVEICHYNIRPLQRFCKIQHTLRERCGLRPTEGNTVLSFRGQGYEASDYDDDYGWNSYPIYCRFRMWKNRFDNLRWWLEKHWSEGFPLYCTNTARFVVEEIVPPQQPPFKTFRESTLGLGCRGTSTRRLKQVEAPEVSRWLKLVQLSRLLNTADTQAFHTILEKLEEDFLALVEPDTGGRMEVDEGGHDSRESDEESRTILGDQESRVEERNSPEEELDEQETDPKSLFDIVIRIIEMLKPSYRGKNLKGGLR